MSRWLCVALFFFGGVSASAGTVNVTFIPRADGLILVPDFLTFVGNNRRNPGFLTNFTSDWERLDYIELNFNAGDAPIQFIAQASAEDAVISPGCSVSMVTQTQYIECGSQTGQLSIRLSPQYYRGSASIGDLQIIGDDVSNDDLQWVPTQTPEPSSLALLTIALAGAVACRRRRWPAFSKQ
ncbi:MAG: PEP-CTERM sorting domain-containing protein [Planctomycetia bacterium]|nr:PEP-CTERM sorting domain-containing protein [Planctomycetia bacterium]